MSERGTANEISAEIDDKVKRDEIRAAYEEANILPAELGAYRLNILQTDAARRQENLDEISRRLAALPERPIPYTRGALAKYARLVSSASYGATTH